ncbi:unnamed protein product, partial [Amoebophrya sp. A25]
PVAQQPAASDPKSQSIGALRSDKNNKKNAKPEAAASSSVSSSYGSLSPRTPPAVSNSNVGPSAARLSSSSSDSSAASSSSSSSSPVVATQSDDVNSVRLKNVKAELTGPPSNKNNTQTLLMSEAGVAAKARRD